MRTWARVYTWGLPDELRQRRLLELESDLWEHLHDPDEPNPARAVFGRFLRGVPADVRWRYRTLLEHRGARQGSEAMTTTTVRRSWWVVMTAVLGAVMITVGLARAAAGASGEGSETLVLLGALTPIVGGGLVLAGLHRRRADRPSGSRLVVAGAVLALLGGFELIPVGIIVVISGIWTGELEFAGRDDAPRLVPVTRQQLDLTRVWYLWLLIATVLFAIGWIPLVIEGDDLTWGYFIWVLSWFGAIVTGAIGVVLAALRLLVRHRTRLA